jgi:hypothetical protein
MRRFCYPVGVLVAGMMLANCSGAAPQPQSALMPSAGAQGGARQERGRSWVLPEAKSEDLLYISDLIGQVVDIYTYGHGYKLVGTLSGFFNPEGLCVDKAGDVFVTNDTSEGIYQITEYAHGGTSPIATLVNTNGRVNGCSVDLKSGDLAVTNFWGETEREGGVSIYRHATGNPTFYQVPSIYYYYYDGYDDRGNLFVDGATYGSSFGLAELPKGGSALAEVNVGQTIYLPGGVQWDGEYLAVGDQVAVKHNFTSVIYQFAISGSTATEVSYTMLEDSSQVAQFWIPGVGQSKKGVEATSVIGPNQDGKDTLFWDYPAGGSPINTISGESDPIGATISLAKK